VGRGGVLRGSVCVEICVVMAVCVWMCVCAVCVGAEVSGCECPCVCAVLAVEATMCVRAVVLRFVVVEKMHVDVNGVVLPIACGREYGGCWNYF
jgi:hypothetical protein